MKMLLSLVKQLFRKIVCIEILNSFLRKVLKFNYIYSYINSVLPAEKKYLGIIPVSGIITFQLPNSKKLCLKSDGNDDAARALYWQGIDRFESGTVALLIKLLKFTHTFLDIGANTGIFALIAALDSSDKKVYAFEPVPSILPYLQNNVKLNQVNNLQICPHAVTNYNGEIKLYIPPDIIPSSASTKEGFREVNKVICVPAITIDSFTKLNHISKVDLIKIDTEATEHIVLQGAKDVLERDEPIIICEVLPEVGTEEHLHAILDRLSYKYFTISSQGLIEQTRIEGKGSSSNTEFNYIFIPQTKVEEVFSQIR